MRFLGLILAVILVPYLSLGQGDKALEQSFKYSKKAGKKYDAGKFEQSIRLYTRAIETDPLNEFNYYLRGMAYKATGQHKAAFSDFDRGITFNTQSKNCYLQRGLIFLKREQFQKALLDFERHISINGETYYFLLKKGEALIGLGQYNEALVALHRAAAKDSNQPEVFLKRAYCYLQIEQMDAVRSDLKNAVLLGSESNERYMIEGLFFLKTGQPDKALGSFNKMKLGNSNKEDAKHYHLLSNGYHVKKEFTKAVEAVTQSIYLDPSPAYYYDRGCYAADSGDLKMALTDFTKVIELDSTFIGAYNNRTFYIWFPEGKFQNAVDDLSKIIELDSANAYAYNNRSYAYFKMGNIEHAFIDAFQSLELESKNPYVYKNLALLYNAIEEKGEATEMAKGALNWGFPTETDPEFKELLIKLELL